jgi:xylulokinase
MACLLGYDIGSSFIKAALLDVETGRLLALASAPDTELQIISPQTGWAEQDPELWWEQVVSVTAAIRVQAGARFQEVRAIGISYQMHGLVVVDREQRPLRPAIIWCDSRAVSIGEKAMHELGPETCLQYFLNSPGNFTASKLKWLQEYEPQIYKQIHKAMLPGEYIAMKLTGEIVTTPAGLSEWVLWDFQNQQSAQLLLEYYGIEAELLPDTVPVFAAQGKLTAKAAAELGLPVETEVSYRAGDQMNNALSLSVLDPGEIAATAGTSGVVYGVDDQLHYDSLSRVNTFVHVNHTRDRPRYGTLLCVNGAAILNRWLRMNLMGGQISYRQMDEMAGLSPAGARGLLFLPYGNGAERTLANRNPLASLHGLDLNRHNQNDLLRAAQEGIVFALNYGVQIMREMGLRVDTVRAGYANMFRSPVFQEAFAAITGVRLELFNTDGAQGAARAAGVGAGIYRDLPEAFKGLEAIQTVWPEPGAQAVYREAYQKWHTLLQEQLKKREEA